MSYVSRENQLQIRWLIRRDMPKVLEIERQSFEFPWSEENFYWCLRQRNCIGMVAEIQDEVVGYMVYELHKSRLHIMNFAVSEESRRQGIGQKMMLRLIDKLSLQRRKEIVVEVRETNLDAQLFFQKAGFLAISVLRSRYEDTAEDAYIMRYLLVEEDEYTLPFLSGNRLADNEAA
jgi:ribosomal-protein-alanine N-acetyltransferase